MELQVFSFTLVFVLVNLNEAADLGGIGGHGGHDDYEYSPYHYEYNVDDDKEYLHFGQEEEDDGQGNVHGYYHVQLPDGRQQRVDYHVNGYSGYIADVKYDGEAHHPSLSHHGGHDGFSGHSGHHSSGHFGGSGRLGKSLNVESRTIEDKTSAAGSESIKHSFNQDHSSTGKHFSGNFGTASRTGKSHTFGSKPVHESTPFKASKSGLITRKKLGETDFFETSASEQINTFQSPLTFFGEAQHVAQEVEGLQKHQKQIHNLQEVQKEFEGLQTAQRQIQNVHHVQQEFQNLKNAQDQIRQIKQSQEHSRFDSKITHGNAPHAGDSLSQIHDLQRIQQETEGLQKAQTQIKTLHGIQQEVQGLQNAQRQIQNLRNFQQEFQGIQSGQRQVQHVNHLQQEFQDIQNAQQHHQGQHTTEHSRFPSLIQHDLFEPVNNPAFNHATPQTVANPAKLFPIESKFQNHQFGFPEVLRGRVIQTP